MQHDQNTTETTVTQSRRVRSSLLAAVATPFAAVMLLAPPAGAQATTASAEADALVGSTEIAAAIAEPSTAYLTIHNEAYVVTPIATYKVQADYSCTGFVVDGDGYLATAGHCVDVGPGSEFDLYARDVAMEAMLEEGVVCGDDACTEDQLDEAWLGFEVEGEAPGSLPEQQITTYLGKMVAGAETRVVEFRPFDEGDVALVKIEADDLPVLELSDATVSVGTPVVSIGYPGVTASVTDKPTLEFTDGKVSSVGTNAESAAPVIGVSAAIDHGMSGGPTVDAQGRVLGINSFGVEDASSHDFIAPASLLREMMAKAGVEGGLSDGDSTYREGFAAWEAGDYAAAEAAFAEVTEDWPGHELAMVWQEKASDLAPAEPPTTGDGEPHTEATSTTGGRADSDTNVVALLVASWLFITAIACIVVQLVRSRPAPAPASGAWPGAGGWGYAPPAAAPPVAPVPPVSHFAPGVHASQSGWY